MYVPRFILMLGSFDPGTRNLLDRLKKELVIAFPAEDLYALLLDEVSLYIVDSLQVVAELWEEKSATLFIFSGTGELIEVEDLSLDGSLSDTVYRFMRENYQIENFLGCPC